MKPFSIILIVFGLIVSTLSFTFKIMHWPGFYFLQFAGLIMIGIGAYILATNKKN